MRLKDICKSFDSHCVLNHFSAIIPDTGVTCVTAPSGAGKTTLMRILMGLETPDSGEISGLEHLRVRAVFQENRLCDWLDAVSNIRLACPERTKDEVQSALQAVQLFLPPNQPVRTLSGGMQRRVALLRGCLSQFDLLILDEPFQGLDADTRAQTAHAIQPYFTQKAVILITHNREDLEFFPIVKHITLP